MERTALAGMRRCLRSGRGLRCTKQTTTPQCIATSICPSHHAAKTASISSSSIPPTKTKRITTTVLRSRPLDTTPLIRREYSTSPPESSPQGTIGQGEAGIPLEAAKSIEKLVAPEHMDEAEKEIWELLNRELEPVKLEVKDVSGGCGSMYAIEVASERFRGLGMLKQQRLVNGVLGERVKGWHGVQMRTSVP